MLKVYDWIEQNPNASRIWVLIVLFVLMAGLSATGLL